LWQTVVLMAGAVMPVPPIGPVEDIPLPLMLTK